MAQQDLLGLAEELRKDNLALSSVYLLELVSFCLIHSQAVFEQSGSKSVQRYW